METGTGSFVCMEENITTMNKEAIEQNYYKPTGDRYHNHGKQVTNKDKDKGRQKWIMTMQ